MTQREKHYMATILDMVDCHDDLALLEVQQVLTQGISFGDYVFAVNRLINLGLIWVDSNHVAHRVRS
jgi:hypothetical protein